VDFTPTQETPKSPRNSRTTHRTPEGDLDEQMGGEGAEEEGKVEKIGRTRNDIQDHHIDGILVWKALFVIHMFYEQLRAQKV